MDIFEKFMQREQNKGKPIRKESEERSNPPMDIVDNDNNQAEEWPEVKGRRGIAPGTTVNYITVIGPLLVRGEVRYAEPQEVPGDVCSAYRAGGKRVRQEGFGHLPPALLRERI